MGTAVQMPSTAMSSFPAVEDSVARPVAGRFFRLRLREDTREQGATRPTCYLDDGARASRASRGSRRTPSSKTSSKCHKRDGDGEENGETGVVEWRLVGDALRGSVDAFVTTTLFTMNLITGVW